MSKGRFRATEESLFRHTVLPVDFLGSFVAGLFYLIGEKTTNARLELSHVIIICWANYYDDQ